MSKATYRETPENVHRLKKLLKLATVDAPLSLNGYEQALRQHVREALTECEFNTLVLYYLRGLGVEDIADKLERNGSTVSRNIRRGTDKALSVIRLARSISPIVF